MKTAILSLLFIISLNLPYGEANAQNVWYVDRDAPTTVRDGRSWATAWTTTDSVWGGGQGVNWKIIQPGDTVYISGGTDSTRYRKVGNAAPSIRGDQLDPNPPNFDPPVVVAPAWHEEQIAWNSCAWPFRLCLSAAMWSHSTSLSKTPLQSLHRLSCFFSSSSFWDESR